MSTIAKEEFQKSLARLENLTKKSQLFHTPSDSHPGTWAGSAPTDEDSMDDMIDENGTDYDGVKKALAQKVATPLKLTKAEVAIVKGENPYPFIRAKLTKGKGLTAAERWVSKGAGRQLFAKYLAKGGMENSPKQDGAGEENKNARSVPDQNVADKDDGKEKEEVGMNKGHGKMYKNDDDDDDHDDKKHPDDCTCPMHKSLASAARTQPDLQKGIEMSPILHQFAVAMGQALEGQEARVVSALQKSLAPVFARVEQMEKAIHHFSGEQGEFNKSIGEAVLGIGQQVAGGAEVNAANASLPAGPPRSQMRANSGSQGNGITPISKSFNGPGGLESGENALAKSQIVNAMTEMVKSGKLNPLEVIKFESTDQLSPGVQQAVLAFAQGNRS